MRFRSSPKADVTGRAQQMRRAKESRSLGSTQVVARDLLNKRKLLDKTEDVSPQPWLLYPHERLGEREPICRCEEVRRIGGRGQISNSL